MRIRPLIPLSAGRELEAEEDHSVEAHLSVCAPCRAEKALFSRLLAEVGVLLRCTGESLPAGVRNRIAAEAAARASRPWYGRLVFPGLPVRPGLLAGAIVILVALMALPLGRRHHPTTSGAESVMKIEVVATGGAIRLVWSDGSQETYRVYKSGDPRGRSGSEVHVVRGNAWVDTEPGSSPIVYYRIE